MQDGGATLYAIYAAAGLAGIMLAEAFYLLVAGNRDRRTAINRRMRLQEKRLSQEQVLIQLRKERGVDGSRSIFSIDRFRALRAQSGLTMALPRFFMTTSGVACGLVLVAVWYGAPLAVALAALPPLCLAIPIFSLRHLRKRRHKLFGLQLPEALELITRGHRLVADLCAADAGAGAGGALARPCRC